MAYLQPNQLVVGSHYKVLVPKTGKTFDLILKKIHPPHEDTIYQFKTEDSGEGLWVYGEQIVNGFYKITEDEFANLGGGKRRRKNTKRRHVKKRKATKRRR